MKLTFTAGKNMFKVNGKWHQGKLLNCVVSFTL